MRGKERNRLKRFFAMMLAVIITATTVYYDGLIVNAEGVEPSTEESGSVVITPADGEPVSFAIKYEYYDAAVTLEGPSEVEVGKSFSFVASEKTGYKITGVEANGGVLGTTAGTYTVENVTDNVTISIDSEVDPSNIYSLEVRYLYEDGKPVQEGFSGSYAEGYAYSIDVPIISGFLATIGGSQVSKVEGTLTQDTVIDVVYKAADISYTVNHRFNNLGSVGYTQETETYSGKAGTETQVSAKIRDGFTPQPFEQITLAQGAENTIDILYTRNMYPVSFEVDGGVYVPRIMKEYGDTVTPASFTSTKIGYDFVGWYLDAAKTQIAPATVTIDKETILYAKWKEKVVDYTVIYWQQKVTDANDGNTSNNTYDYKESAKQNAKAGSLISTSTPGIQKSYNGFNLNSAKSVSVTVAPDGKSILNVYYDRQVYTINFLVKTKDSDKTYSTFASVQGLFESPVGYWPNTTEVENANSGKKKFAGWKFDYLGSTYMLEHLERYCFDGISESNVVNVYATFESSLDKAEFRHYLENPDGKSYATVPYVTSYSYNSSSGIFYFTEQFEGFQAVQYRTKIWNGFLIFGEWVWTDWKNVPSGGVNYDKELEIRHARKSYNLDFYNYNKVDRTNNIKFGAPVATYTWTPGRPSVLPDYYTFGGWYTSKECVAGTEFNFSGSTMPAKNLVLYAKWTAPQVAVTFNSNGGSAVGSQNVSAGQPANEPADPIKAGFVFEGWYSDAGLNNLYDFGAPVSSSGIILYAKWKQILTTTFTVRYQKAGTGEALFPEVLRSGTVGRTYTVYSKSNDEYVADAVSKSITLSADPAGNVVVFTYSKPQNVSYRVEYWKTSGTEISSTVYSTDHSVITVNANPPAGYIANQSSITKTLANELTEATIQNNVIRFYCDAKKYNIWYFLNGGTQNPANPSTYTYFEAVTFQAPTRTDYIFKGWYTTSTFDNGTLVTGIPTGSTGNKRVYAKWEAVPSLDSLTVTGGTWPYDGAAHGVSISGTQGAAISYSLDGINYGSAVPVVINVEDGTKTVWVKAELAGYKATVKSATIAITPRPIEITADSGSRAYNGEEFTVNGYSITAGSFVNEEGFENVNVTGSITFPGVSANTITGYTLKSNTDEHNYAITKKAGELAITAGSIAIIVKASSAHKTYDGLPLKLASIETVSGLMPGDTVAATVAGEITNFGTAENIVNSVSIMHGTTDVTANYSISKVPGILKVEQKEISISANSESKVYDGDKLSNNTYQILSGSTASGEELHVTIAGEITDVGSVANAIENISVTRGGADTTGNYDIKKQNGTLSVTKREIEIIAKSDSRPYNGEPLILDAYSVSGDFAKEEGLESVTVSGSQLFAGYSDNVVTGYTLKSNTKAENYNIKTAKGRLEVTGGRLAIQVIADSVTKEYDQTELTSDKFTVTGNLASGDKVTAKVSGSIMDAGTVSNNVTDIQVMHGTTDVTKNYVIEPKAGTLTVTPRKIVISSNSASRAYNGEILMASGYTITEGSFYGSDGIEYVNVYGRQLFPGISDNYFDYYSPYVLKDGTMEANYEISTVMGKLEVIQSAIGITVTANSESRPYNGSPLENDGHTMTGTLANGDVIDVTVEGSITNAGVSANRVTDVKIRHNLEMYAAAAATSFNMEDPYEIRGVDVTENYVIEKVDGTLTINGVPLVITANSLTGADAITYGDDVPNGKFTSRYEGFIGNDGTDVLSGTLAYDTTYAKGSIPGNYTVTPSGLTAKNYVITYMPGTLEVKKAELTVSAKDVILAYGDALPDSFDVTYSGFRMSGDEEGFNSIQKTSALAIKEGKPIVTSNYTVGAQTGEKFDIVADVSGMKSDRYTFKPVTGTLSVDYRPVTIKVASTTITEGDTPTFSYGVSNLAVIGGVKKQLNAPVKLKSAGSDVGSHAIKVSNASELLNKTFENYKVIDINNGLLTVNAAGGGTTTTAVPAPVVTPAPIVITVPAVTPAPVAPAAVAPAPAVPAAVAPAAPVTIEDEETPLAETVEDAAQEIPDEEVPLAAPVEDCWIHWLILLLSLAYTIYSVVRIYFRNKKIKEAGDDTKLAKEV